MKIYTLHAQKGLIKIITYPDQPDSGMKLFFDTYAQGQTESVVSSKEIWKYVQMSIYSETIGKDLAIAIANDYPLLFKKPLEFPSPKPVPSLTNTLFSHLDGDLKAYAENRLKQLDEKIANAPDYLKLKIDRAELLCHSGEYQRALSEYTTLLPVCRGNGHYTTKIKRGLATCNQEIEKATTIFQTPFFVEEQINKVEQPQHSINVSTNNATLFTTSKLSKSKHHDINIENIPLTKDLSLLFEHKVSLGIPFSIMVNGIKQPGMFINDQDKQTLIDYQQNPAELISLLKTWGKSAEKIAEIIESTLKVYADIAYGR